MPEGQIFGELVGHFADLLGKPAIIFEKDLELVGNFLQIRPYFLAMSTPELGRELLLVEVGRRNLHVVPEDLDEHDLIRPEDVQVITRTGTLQETEPAPIGTGS